MEQVYNVEEIVKCAKKVFCDGIYVPANEHPCGWDFISFESLELASDVDFYCFEDSDISNGIYGFHPYTGLTLAEILQKTKNVYEFEISSINW